MPCAVYFINFARSSASASRQQRGRARERGKNWSEGGEATHVSSSSDDDVVDCLCLSAVCAVFASAWLPCSLRLTTVVLSSPPWLKRARGRDRGRGRVVAWFLLTSYVTHIRVSFRNKSKRKKASFFLAWLLEKYNKKKHSNNNNYRKCKAKQVYAAQWQRWQRNPLWNDLSSTNSSAQQQQQQQ